MNAPEVNLIRENEREIYFAHRPAAGIIFIIIGLGLVYFFSFFPNFKTNGPKWLFSIFGLLFAAAGLAGTLWRFELKLDLLSRVYYVRRGFWPGPKTFKGPLDDLEGIVLTSRVVRSNKSTYTVWNVSLSFKGLLKSVTISESRTEVAAHQKMEYYAKKLRIPAIDRTGTEERRTEWTDLDKPLSAKPDHAVSIPLLPQSSRIEFLNRPGTSRILLPRQGISFSSLFLVFFGMPFAGIGSILLFMTVSGTEMGGNVVAGAIFSSVFLFAGLLIILVGISSIWGRQLIEEDGPEIVSGFTLAGKKIRPQRIQKREVEEVSIKPVPGRRSNQQQITIRSDKKIIRISCASIKQQEMEWLKTAVQCLVTR